MTVTYVFQISLTSFYPVQAYSHLVKLFYSKAHHDVSQMSLDALKCVYSFAQVRLLVVKHDLA